MVREFKAGGVEIEWVSEAYGFSTTHQAPFVTARLDTYPKSDLVAEVSQCIANVEPDTIYLPYRNDVHSDHAAVFVCGGILHQIIPLPLY